MSSVSRRKVDCQQSQKPLQIKYIYMCSRTNEDILHIADIIRRGCLDFKLDPKFDLHFTKYRVKKSDEVVPIDLDAFLYDHILKVDY